MDMKNKKDDGWSREDIQRAFWNMRQRNYILVLFLPIVIGSISQAMSIALIIFMIIFLLPNKCM